MNSANFAITEFSEVAKSSLDKPPFFAGCASPKSYTDLSEGSHTFEVRTTDAAGNADPAAATRSWNVRVPSGKH